MVAAAIGEMLQSLFLKVQVLWCRRVRSMVNVVAVAAMDGML